MPYIKHSRRKELEKPAQMVACAVTHAHAIGVSGALNASLCTIMGEIYNKWPTYATIEMITGAMHSALTEFERRIVAPHENGAITRNGDLDAFRGGK